MRAVTGSVTVAAILRLMKSVAALLANRSTPMSLKVANMNWKPPPCRHQRSNTASRSSSLTALAGVVLSSKPNPVMEPRTRCQ